MATLLAKKLRVLIVDDDEIDRMALRRALKGTDFDIQVSEAVDAKAALDAIAHETYDCFFLDYHLPDLNGLELIQRIRHQGIKVPLIVLTGQGDEQTAVDLMKAGASDYLPKSRLSSESIARVIRGAIRVYHAEMIVDKTNSALREKNQLLEKQNRELAQQRQYIYKQNLQLQEVSRLKSEFLATMSHELRTPLNAIIGFSQILLNKAKKGSLSDYQQDMLGRVLSNGRNLLELINDILAFSKLEAGRLDLEPVDMDMDALVTETVRELQSLATQKSLTLKVDVALDNTVVVNDAARLRQILVNLLSNAIKFTTVGTVCVSVTDSAFLKSNGEEDQSEEDQSDTITMMVSDTGCGISAADQAYIFDPFHQADQKVSRKHSGTGLGLAITHSLVKMMHGDITLVSNEGQGTTFWVEIPRVVIVYREHAMSGELVAADRAG